MLSDLLILSDYMYETDDNIFVQTTHLDFDSVPSFLLISLI